MVIEVGDRRPQAAVDAASPGETVVFDPSTQHTIEDPLTVTRPGVTLRGPNLRLADRADEDLIAIGADGVDLVDFTLDGNRANQPGERQSSGVLVTGASEVRIGNGRIEAVSRHGLRIVDTATGTSLAPGDTIHVERGAVSDATVRDVRIDSPRRDGCSVEGPDLENVSVENVRTFGSSDRGSVEVKDGASDAYVGHCYAEDCVYGVAVQDHGEYPTANVRIAGNTAVDCETLVDAQTSHPPEDVVVTGNVGRDLGGDGMGGPGGIHAHLIEGLVVANNVLRGVDGPGIAIRDCVDAAVTGNVVRDSEDPGIVCRGEEAGDGEPDASDLQVSDNRCTGGIELSGGVDRYLVTDNLLGAAVIDDAEGSGLVANNLD